VFTRRDGDKLPEVVHWHPGVRVVHVPAGPARPVRKEELLPYMEDFARWICDFARANGGYRVAHANFFMSGIAAEELRRCLGIPMVVTFHALGRVRRLHQGDADQFPAERIAIEERICAGADAIIAECPQDRDDLTALYAADPRRIAVIPCGFDRGEFWPITKPFARRALGLAVSGDPIIVNIGRLVPRKGLDNVIRGAARLARRHGINTRVLVVGGNSDLPDPVATPEIARLQALADGEGIGGNVTFTGRRSREFLKLYYSAADLFVTTPWYEPFGITPLEAMACGTPVVGSDVGGIRYSVADGVTGCLVPPNDPEALAGRMAELLRAPWRVRELGRAGIARVHARFTWKKVVREVSGLYEAVSRAAVAA
jgi:glycosyltransferase involved in cell wall biosynthesis